MCTRVVVGTDIGINEVNFHGFAVIVILTILSLALPSPNGFCQLFSLVSITKIVDGLESGVDSQ